MDLKKMERGDWNCSTARHLRPSEKAGLLAVYSLVHSSRVHSSVVADTAIQTAFNGGSFFDVSGPFDRGAQEFPSN
jgi:hypothetical protein